MHPALHRAAAQASDLARRGLALIRLHPVLAALALPALVLAYALLLVPFTPSINDLRKARPRCRRRCCPPTARCWPNTGASTASG